MTKLKSRYAEYAALRAACETFTNRLSLGRAIRNGWNASTLTALGQDFFNGGRRYSPKDFAYQQAILEAAPKLYVEGLSVYAMPPDKEERIRIEEEWEAKRTKLLAQYPAPPPVVPEHSARVRLNRLICPTPDDRVALDNAFRAGWSPAALTHLAEYKSIFSRMGKRAAMGEAIAIAGDENNVDHLDIREKHKLLPNVTINQEKHRQRA